MMPGSSAPLENLGVLALEEGDAAAARRTSLGPSPSRQGRRARTPEPAPPPSAAAIAPAAYDAWARAVQLDPANYEAMLSLGVNLARDGRLGEARPYLQRVLEATPPVLPPAQRREVDRLLRGRDK